jgi:hypothetical protein
MPPAQEDRYLVCLVCLVFGLNETNQMNQINQINKTNQSNQTNYKRRGRPVSQPAIFMNASAAIADSPLRQAWTRLTRRPGRRARPPVGQHTVSSMLPSLAAPRACLAGDCAISRRIVMNNAG